MISFRAKLYSRHAKRIIDLIITVPAFVLLVPIIGLFALLVRIRLGSPVFLASCGRGWADSRFGCGNSAR